MLGTTCGKHYWSSLNDLRTWTTNGCAYQAKGVLFAPAAKGGNATRVDFGRRERPHLIFGRYNQVPAAPPVPVAFTSAVTAMPTACVGAPHCLYRYPDASYTLLQSVNVTR